MLTNTSRAGALVRVDDPHVHASFRSLWYPNELFSLAAIVQIHIRTTSHKVRACANPTLPVGMTFRVAIPLLLTPIDQVVSTYSRSIRIQRQLALLE